MAITAIRTSTVSSFFGGEAGELGPCNVYYASSVRPNLTGTIDTTLGSTAVTGTGTAFTTELKPGGYILTAGGKLIQIASITNNTALVLQKAAVATETGVTAKPFYTVWLGKTQNVVFNDNQQFSPITFIQTGQAPQNQIETSYEGTVTVDLAENSIERLTQIFDHIRGSRDATTGVIEGMYRKISIGSAHQDYADRLTIVKIKGGVDSSLPNEKLTVLRCAPMLNMNLTFDATSQRVVQATFQMYQSSYYIDGAPLMYYSGDLSSSTVTDIDGNVVASIDSSFP